MTNDIHDESNTIWEQNAAFWDERGGDDGLIMQRTLIAPATERLLDVRPGERVLEIACGNGAFARRLVQLGTHVVACDVSPTFIERAKARTTQNADRIDYRVIDATDRDALLALGVQSFDAAVCTMALMDMPEIAPLLWAVRELLKPGGRFVFSISHPCFNSSPGLKRVAVEEDRDGQIIDVYAIQVSGYAAPETYRGLGIIGQPVPQYYFHRPLNLLFGECFRAGFVIDGIEEPCFAPESTPNRVFSWENYHDIPPVLIARLR